MILINTFQLIILVLNKKAMANSNEFTAGVITNVEESSSTSICHRIQQLSIYRSIRQ